MEAGFSAVIDPLQLAKQGKRLNGQFALQALPRLAVLSCKSAAGKVAVDLQFSRGEDHQNRVAGTASACFEVICQRCLKPVSLQVDCEVNVFLLGSRENNIENSDGIVCKGKMPLADLIEDNLLLTMPMFPKHQTRNCGIKDEQAKSAANVEKTGRKDNPFAVLAELKLSMKTGNVLAKKPGKK